MDTGNQGQPTEGGRLQKLIEAGDSQELARRTFTLQSVAREVDGELLPNIDEVTVIRK